MEITSKQFEKAIEVAYLEGLKGSLADLLTPHETQSRIKVATIKSYVIIQPKEEKSTMDATEIENRFARHPMNEEYTKVSDDIRERALHFALFINAHCPDSREKSQAITSLDDTVKHAVSAIARHMPF